MTTTIETALANFRCGDLSDDDLQVLLPFFRAMEDGLRKLGPEYHLAWVPVLQDFLRLEDAKRARRL